MFNFTTRGLRVALLTLAAAMLTPYMIGCSAGSSSSGAGLFGANITGSVSASGSSSGLIKRILTHVGVVKDASLAGCTATAYDVNGNSAVASATVDSSGNFTISGGSVTAGSNYKVVITCPGNSQGFTAIIGADNTQPSAKTPAPVNPVTTLIATEVVSAIMSAVQNATTGLAPSVQTAIINSLLTPSVIANIVSTVQTTIQSAIDNGTMQPPSAGDCLNLSTAVAGASATNNTTAGSALTSVTNTVNGATSVSIPAAVSSTVSGAAQSAAAFPNCDSTLSTASQTKCTQAVASMMFNMLHFDIALRNSGGVFGTIACDNASDTTLMAQFPGAVEVTGSSMGFDTNFCILHQKIASVDRNCSYADQCGGHGPLFSESGYSVTAGVISALGSALYNNTNFHASDIDSLVFGSSGMNGRLLLAQAGNFWPTLTNGNYQWESFTFDPLTVSGGVTAPNPYGSWPSCSGSPCNPDNNGVFSFNFSQTDYWATDTLHAGLAAAIDASSYAGSVFLDKFGGTIPNESQINSQFINATTHADQNRTGQSKFMVLYSKQPDWNDPNCQWNSSSQPVSYVIPSTATSATPTVTTDCVALDGTPHPYVTVNVGLATPSGSQVSYIDSITVPTSGSGTYYLLPVSNGEFKGLFQLVNASTGALATDELLNQRFVQTILSTSQCSDGTSPAFTGVPASTGTCAVGAMYNVTANWNNCNGGGGSNCPAISATSAQVANVVNHSSPANAFNMASAVNYMTHQINSGTNGPGMIGAINSTGTNWNSFSLIDVTGMSTLTGALAAGTQAADLSPGGSLSAGSYAFQQYWNCTSNPCVSAGYILLSSTGVPFQISGTPATNITKGSVCLGGGPNTMCTSYSNVAVYSDTYLNGLGSVFNYADTGTGTWQNVALSPTVNQGPASNPTWDCSLDPFFIDANGNGKLDYTVGSNGVVTCSEISFSDPYSAAQYVQGGNGMTAHGGTISINQNNAFVFGDPKAASTLLHAAFGPWLDGSHSLTSTTNLNGLQVFSLVYLFFTAHEGQNGDVHNIPNLLPNSQQNMFLVLNPTCNGSSGQCNISIANGITTYHQAAP